MAVMTRPNRSRSGPVPTLVAIVAGTGILAAFAFEARHVRLESPASHRARSLLRLDSALGATLEPLDSRSAELLGGGARADEMVVTSVAAGGRGALAGLRVGDVVEKVDGADPADVDAALDAVSSEPTELLVRRAGSRAMLRLGPQSSTRHA